MFCASVCLILHLSIAVTRLDMRRLLQQLPRDQPVAFFQEARESPWEFVRQVTNGVESSAPCPIRLQSAAERTPPPVGWGARHGGMPKTQTAAKMSLIDARRDR